MPIIPEVVDYLDELTQIRRDIHAHPELGFTEQRTGDIVAKKLEEWGVEVHRGLATTGVVGTIRRGNSLRAIGLRADMDCLPMQELNEFAHRSTDDGKMHACGHDGHTTMLLGAARYLAATRNFNGVVHFIFQPGEEGYAGGRVMVEEGLFRQFPCDAVFAMHNKPGIPIGNMAVRPGPMLAASDRFDIHVKGRGGHAAHPHLGTDPFVVAAQIVLALQTIPARNVDPIESSVISIGFMRGGSAYNVIPDEFHIGGTVRCFRPEVRDLLERRMGEIVRGTAAAHGAA
ncbi:MAG TPA: amidohydrolase, partial [Stellaceae bacterium]|nr:amidohydrolase [Stellaceae bacterium]